MIELYVVAHEQWFLDYPEDLVTKRAQWSLDYYDIGNPELWNSQKRAIRLLVSIREIYHGRILRGALQAIPSPTDQGMQECQLCEHGLCS